MKKLLFICFTICALTLNAQTTYQISWQIGSNGDAASLTIEIGDTVQWLWDDGAPHTVTNKDGSTQTFDSGQLTGTDVTYSFTFTQVGTNPYQCDVHPGSMFGVITVQEVLSLEDNTPDGFKLISNLTTDVLTIQLPDEFNIGALKIHDLSGRQIEERKFNQLEDITMDVATLNDGIYILSIESNGVEFAQRFVKQ